MSDLNELLAGFWVPAVKEPQDCSRYAPCSMNIINNAGFVTVGFWYPKSKQWLDTNDKDITKQVIEWMPMPIPTRR